MESARRCDTPQPLTLPRRDQHRTDWMRESDFFAEPSLIDELTGIISRAAAAILAARAGTLAARAKPDASPVTAADEASEAVILAGLSRALPGVPVVSEEAGAPLELGRGD